MEKHWEIKEKRIENHVASFALDLRFSNSFIPEYLPIFFLLSLFNFIYFLFLNFNKCNFLLICCRSISMSLHGLNADFFFSLWPSGIPRFKFKVPKMRGPLSVWHRQNVLQGKCKRYYVDLSSWCCKVKWSRSLWWQLAFARLCTPDAGTTTSLASSVVGSTPVCQ